MAHALVHGRDVPLRDVAGGIGDGLRVATYVSAAEGAVHLETAVSELAPGGAVRGHLHPFEESFYVLAGRGLLAIGDTRYEVQPGDFGFAPLAFPHAWSNPSGEPLRWLRVRSPQPRPIGPHAGTYPVPDLPLPSSGRPITGTEVGQRFVGHFADEQLPPPGPLSMPGYHGYNVRNVSVRMMVDEQLGARHQALFVVQFQPATGLPAGELSAKEHFHPFEEIYFFTAGQARGRLAGQACEVAAGDLVFAGVGASHGFTNSGDTPVRWIEAQAPAPPAADGFFFEDDWVQLGHRLAVQS